MFAIVTDSSANLDYKALSLENITVAPFSYNINGEEHSCPPVNGFDGTAYYEKRCSRSDVSGDAPRI